jgi:hypothetical protein
MDEDRWDHNCSHGKRYKPWSESHPISKIGDLGGLPHREQRSNEAKAIRRV